MIYISKVKYITYIFSRLIPSDRYPMSVFYVMREQTNTRIQEYADAQDHKNLFMNLLLARYCYSAQRSIVHGPNKQTVQH